MGFIVVTGRWVWIQEVINEAVEISGRVSSGSKTAYADVPKKGKTGFVCVAAVCACAAADRPTANSGGTR